MNIFLGWSGEISHNLALIFHDWLPQVIQRARPYVSSEDIAKGERWFADIEAKLADTHFGIIFITEENLSSPWIHYEAGYLANKMTKSSLCPFLFGVEATRLSGSPLLQFQYADAREDEIFKLVKSINDKLEQADRLDEIFLKRMFDTFWKQLSDKLEKLKDQNQETKVVESTVGAPNTDAILSELLDLVRKQDRLLSDPRQLIPKEYIEMLITKRGSSLDAKMTEAWTLAAEAIRNEHFKLIQLVSEFKETFSNIEGKPFDQIIDSLRTSTIAIQVLLSTVSRTDYRQPVNNIIKHVGVSFRPGRFYEE